MFDLLRNFGRDIRLAVRVLLKKPAFTAVAVLTLAIGISANTTIFSMISAFFFQPLPVKEPSQLVMVLQKSAVWKMPHGHSWLDYLDYRQRVSVFSDALATMMNPAHLSLPGKMPERVWIEAVSGNYFSMLGVEPALGRLFQAGEGEKAGADSILVLSHAFWRRNYGGDPSVIGKPINLNGKPFTVIGVTPPAFDSAQWGIATHAFVPASMLGQVRMGGEELLKQRGAPAFKVMARLKPGGSLGQARASVAVVAKQLAADYPEEHKEATVFVLPERQCRPEPTFSEFMPLVASVFMVMVILVLLIACANVANLMFSRALVRQREMGIRTAIGATRWRLIRQCLAESIVLGVCAGVAGLILAVWSSELLNRFNPGGDIPIRTDHGWDWRVFAFTFLVSVFAGVATGIFPALRATRLDVQSTLKEGAGTILGSSRHLFRSGLVISQVAICLVVLVCSGLFVRSLQQVASLDLGFRTDHLVMASLDLGLQGYDQNRGRQFCRELAEKVQALPGVRSVSLAKTVPFDYGFEITKGAPEEKAGNKNEFVALHCNRVDAQYFKTMGMSLLRGRAFSERDNDAAPKVAIVNATMAERFWPGQDPLGKRFRFGDDADFWTVVGLARTSRYVMIGEAPRPFFQVPLAQKYDSPLTLHVWTSNDPAILIPALRQVLRELDEHLPIYNLRTMEEHLRDSAFALMPLRMGATLAGVQGLLGLLLAVMGIYGVVSYVASQRTREIGIRMALGADHLNILRLVVREGVRLAAIGMAIGLIAALGLAQIISRLLYGLTPASLPVFAAVSLLLAGVVLAACWLPARRAAKVDPMWALRYE